MKLITVKKYITIYIQIIYTTRSHSTWNYLKNDEVFVSITAALEAYLK